MIHTGCCVLKLHGDYLDTRIRNTPGELDDYPPEFNGLLDRVFDEFGLIVCGWSAEWDGALRKALFRAPSRRFTTYWAVQGQPGDQARRLIGHRGAEVVQIEDADSFFETVRGQVESLEEFSRPHPFSMEAAVASLKRYVSEPRYRVQLSDLISETVERVVEATSGETFPLPESPPDTESVTARVRAYEAACSTLAAIAVVGGFWAEKDHDQHWQRALETTQPSTIASRLYYLAWLTAVSGDPVALRARGRCGRRRAASVSRTAAGHHDPRGVSRGRRRGSDTSPIPPVQPV